MLSLDGNLIVVFIIVWILVVLLSRFFFRPVRRVRDVRAKGIQENRKAYEEALQASEKSLQDIEKALKQARIAAESAQEALAEEALKEKSRLISDISAECKGQVDRARLDLDKTVRELKKKLESETSGLAEDIEKKFLN